MTALHEPYAMCNSTLSQAEAAALAIRSVKYRIRIHAPFKSENTLSAALRTSARALNRPRRKSR